MKRIFSLFLLLLMSLFVTASFAYETVPGDVIVVLRSSPGMSLYSVNSTNSLNGLKSISAVQSFVESFPTSSNINVTMTYDALSEKSGNIFMLVHSDKKDENELLSEIQSHPDVIAASLNRIVHVCSSDAVVPNDPEYYRLWGIEAINAPKVWNVSTGSEDVYVAVIDSGVDYNHQDLKDNFSHKYSRNFVNYGRGGDPSDYMDYNDHGTHVSGTIGAVGNNGIGVAGVNWKVKIISVRSMNANGSGSTADIVAAINYLAGLLTANPNLNLASVNMSIGGFSPYPPFDAIENSDPSYLALKTLSSLNRTVICVSAGNEAVEAGAPVMNNKYDSNGNLTLPKGYYPYYASFPDIDNMIAVAAAGPSLTRASYSNYSPSFVHVAAPGGDINAQGNANGLIFSTVRTNASVSASTFGSATVSRDFYYAAKGGTSMAAPHVSGMAALLKTMYPEAKANQIRAAIVGSANPEYLRDDGTSMYGLIDVERAVNFLDATMKGKTPPKITASKLHGGTVNQTYKFEFFASGSEPINWNIDGDLPQGLSFDNGMIIGTPKEEGQSSFLIVAENDYGYDSMFYTLSIDAGTAPVINTSSDINDAYTGAAYQLYVETEKGSWPLTWSVGSSDMPSDFKLTINDKIGLVEFSPSSSGTYKFTVTAENYAGSDSREFTVNVVDPKIPVIESKDLKSAVKGMAYGISNFDEFMSVLFGPSQEGDTITASGVLPISWDINGLPEGLTSADWVINGLTGQSDTSKLKISGTPKEAGSFGVTVTASNAYGTASRDFTIYVKDEPPTILSLNGIATFSMNVGIYASSRVNAFGTAPMTFSIEGEVPDGITVTKSDSTVNLRGTPTEAGTYTFTVYASNDKGVASADVVINVREPAVITTKFLPDAVKGEPYNFSLSSLNGAAVSWSADSMPQGLTLTDSGDIEGTPGQAGKFSIAITANFPNAASSNETFSLLVKEIPSVNAISLPDGEINVPYEVSMLSADGTAPIWWSVSEGNLPGGLTLTGNGYIYGTPYKSGDYIFTVKAANTAGEGSKTFTIKIASDGSESTDPDPVPPTPPSSDPVPTVKHGAARGISELTVGEMTEIENEHEIVAAVLPEISVDTSGLYNFESYDFFANINISNDVPEGALLVWHPFTRSVTGTLIENAESENSNASFYNSNGEFVEVVPSDKIINVSAWLDSGKLYAPVISAVESGDKIGLGSSSGGCNSGIESLAIIISACALFFRRKGER